jgi:hypothetical protein
VAEYRWPAFAWRLGFDAFVEAEHTEVLASPRSSPARSERAAGSCIARRRAKLGRSDEGDGSMGNKIDRFDPGDRRGIGLAIAAFLSWGTVSLDAAKFASALGIDRARSRRLAAPDVAVGERDDGWEGKLAVVAASSRIVIGVIAIREVRKGWASC